LHRGPKSKYSKERVCYRSRTHGTFSMDLKHTWQNINSTQCQNHQITDYTSSITQPHFSLSLSTVTNSNHHHRTTVTNQNHHNRINHHRKNPQIHINFLSEIHHLAYKTNSKFQNIKMEKCAQLSKKRFEFVEGSQ
jgi:hypothetical protein